MATIKFYLDTRFAKQGPAPLKVCISHKGSSTLISLDVHLAPDEWDFESQRIVNRPDKAKLNNAIMRRYLDIESQVMELEAKGRLKRLSATQLRHEILNIIEPSDETTNNFIARYRHFMSFKKGRTLEIYQATLSRLYAFDPRIEKVVLEDIDRKWLMRFDQFLAITSPSANARAIHLRNIRAVFNDAIDDEVTSHYPFRRFQIKKVPTAKRSLTAEELRTFLTYPVEKTLQRYQDMAKLIFYLVGINIADLCHLNYQYGDRIEYNRMKTHRRYSIKVEPEAQEIIDKYRGNKYLLNIMDGYCDYRGFARALNIGLGKIGEVETGRYNAKTRRPLFPNITTYWLRHTWATIAASLEIPKETIAAALGHGGNTVTDIYINFDQKKIDEANRRVMDWVLYDKR